MANFKIVVSDPKSRKAYQKEVDQRESGLSSKKIGDKVSGDFLGLSGYELEITGGSDQDGFPMRKDVEGIGRKRALLSFPPGFHPQKKGQRKRKSIRGNTISGQIVQINAKVVTHGTKPLAEVFGKPEEKKEEKPKPEKPKEAKKEERHKEETAEEKPKEEAKPEKTPETAEKAEKKLGIKKLE